MNAFLRRRLASLPHFLCLAAMVVFAVVPTGVFELDGDSVDSGVTGDDWNTLNGAGPSGCTTGVFGSPGGSLVREFACDPAGQTIFSGGGSKDERDLSQWRHSAGSVPDKDEIVNAYAAAYNNGSLNVVFGADRLATNGDANIGIWFFQSHVTLNSNGTFAGAHTNGDVFVVSQFNGGGGNSTISVYTWDNSCLAAASNNPQAGQCAGSNIRVKYLASGACGSSDACAITNTDTIQVSWNYLRKQGGAPPPNGEILKGGFFEGGVNLTSLFGDNVPCFTSYLMETRSSSSIDATLKDFVIADFPLCGLSVAKVCNCQNFVATDSQIGYTNAVSGTVNNVGVGTLYNVTVVDDAGTASTTDDLVFNCGTMNGKTSKTWGLGGECTAVSGSTYFSTALGSVNRAAVSGSTAASGGVTLTANTGDVTCATQPACVANPALVVTKTCRTTLEDTGSTIAIGVKFNGLVSNTGNVRLNDVVVVSDNGTPGTIPVPIPASGDDQSFTVGALEKSGTAGDKKCYVNILNDPLNCTAEASYFPSAISASIGAGRARFDDVVRARGTNPLTGAFVYSDPLQASCLVCPAGACPVP